MSDQAFLFSVVMAVHNRPSLVLTAIESVLSQRHDDFELVIVDDGSSDDTPAVLAAYADRSTIIHQPNQGPAAARNRGVASARGRYACIIDSDDLWFPWTLATFERALRASQWPALLAGQLLPFTAECDLSPIAEDPLSFEAYAHYLASSRSGYFVGSGMAVYSTRAFQKVGGFDTRLANVEDHDLSLRLGMERGFVKILSPATLAYRQHPGSVQRVDLAFEGLMHCLHRERSDRYPGGPGRRGDRRRLLTLHTRAHSLRCLAADRSRLAWRLYADTFVWNLREARARYLAGFPLTALKRATVRPVSTTRPNSSAPQ